MGDKLIERTILEEKEYKIPVFNSLTVGDPMYFENGVGNKYTLDTNLPAYANRKAGIILQKINYKWELEGQKDYLTYDTINAIIYNISPNSKNYVEAHTQGCHFSDLQKKIDLGCDSAEFEIVVNGKGTDFQTGADGMYGNFYKYPHNRAYILELELDPDYIPLQQIKQKLGFVFDCKELTQEKTRSNQIER